MEIVIDPLAPREAAPRIQDVVFRARRGRRLDNVRVYVSRPRPGRWSVFIAGLREHPLPLVESIEAELTKAEITRRAATPSSPRRGAEVTGRR